MNINELFSELAQYTRIAEETAAIVDGLKDQIKKYMDELGTDTLIADEHKATYKTVASSRIDTTALKKNEPQIAQAYTVKTEARRFTFA